MSSNTVAQFATELKMPANVLLEQLRSAGVDLKSVDDAVTDSDKAKLLESLRRAHGATEGKKITWRDGFPALWTLVKLRFKRVP